jgi:hypothetical protein
MRRLFVILAVGIAFAIVGLPAFADSSPALTATTTMTTSAAPTAQAPAPRQWFAGEVSSVGSESIAVGVLWTGPNDGALNGQTLNLGVVTSSRISQGPLRTPIALGQIQDGDLVAISAIGDPSSSLTAARIHVYCNCHWIGGTITQVNGSNFMVQVGRTGPYDTALNGTTVTMQLSNDTVYLSGPHADRVGYNQLGVGDGVGVVFSANGFFKAPGFDPSTATFTAARVHLWPHRIVPPAASDAAAAAQTDVG